MKRTVTFALACLAVLLAACGSGGGAASTGSFDSKTPTQVLANAITAAKKSGSVHFTLLGEESGKTESIVGDASGSDGREVITAGAVSIQAEVVAGAAFVEGNAGGLEDQMGLSAADAKTYSGKWISIAAPTDAPYSAITKAVTLASTLSELQPTGKLSLTATTTKASHPVVGIHGGLPGGAAKGVTGSATLYVSTTRPTVPILFSSQQNSSGVKESDTGTFTKWGKALNLVAPTASVAFASLPVPTTTTPSG